MLNIFSILVWLVIVIITSETDKNVKCFAGFHSKLQSYDVCQDISLWTTDVILML